MIDRFSGEHDFLSNFHPSPITLRGMEFATVEHAFQAFKTLDPALRERIRTAGTPGRAKRLGRQVELRHDWEQIKLSLMEALLRRKFWKEPFRSALISTAPHELVEGNHWNDTFWGVCGGVGENHLGKLLMKIREEISHG